MLANLASSLVTLERFDECAAVSEFALRELPQDHSVWWHRRYLAEVAYERRDFAACREWSFMSTAEYPTVKVAVAQLDTLAQMALARGWWARRRILSRALPELLRQWRLADAETRGSGDSTEMMWKRFFRLQPSLRALLLACGVWGRRRLERRDD